MLYTQRKHLHFLLDARNQHGVHSPFVYQLITKCFYKKMLKNLWENFLNEKQYIVDKNKKRPASKIAKASGLSNKKAKILIKTVHYFKPKNILGIGTSLSLITSAIKTGTENAAITTLEGCTETSKIVEGLFEEIKFNGIEVINSDFSKTFSKCTQNKQFDCVFFGGNQTKQASLNYFEECLKTIHNDSFFVFDGIYWTAEMQEAWSIIKKHPKVTVTIDLFYFGIIFFRKEQAKEHFKIKV
ncbi:MAG: putative O-methyltransferase YrrM [Polaribacter sp.]|jgi:predicted O-methyltransferase YrrM